MNDEYLKYMHAFATLVSEAAAHTLTVIRQPAEKGKASKDQPEFVPAMRELIGKHIKPISTDNRILARAIGQYYGAFVSHLAGIVAKWQTIQSDCGNPLIDINKVASGCCAEVLGRAVEILDAANAYAARLWQFEIGLTSKSMLFSREMEALIQRNGILYKSPGGSSFDVLGCCCSRRSPGVHALSFLYWDGADAIGFPMGALLARAEDRDSLRELARQCFGAGVKLSDDLDTLEVSPQIPLVQPCGLEV